MTGTTRKPDEPGGRKDRDERDLDEALDKSFPASDPPSTSRMSTGAPDHPGPRAGVAERSRTAKKK